MKNVSTSSLEHLQVHRIRECRKYSQSNTNRRRVVVTGVGVVSPIGCNVQLAWKNLLSGYCGVKALKDSKYDSLPCKIAATITEDEIKLQDHFSKSELRSIAPATAYALIAGSLP